MGAFNCCKFSSYKSLPFLINIKVQYRYREFKVLTEKNSVCTPTINLKDNISQPIFIRWVTKISPNNKMEKSLSTLTIQSFRRRNLPTKGNNDDYSSLWGLTSRSIKNGGTTLISIISAPPISCYQPMILLVAKDSVEIQVLFSSASKIIPIS